MRKVFDIVLYIVGSIVVIIGLFMFIYPLTEMVGSTIKSSFPIELCNIIRAAEDQILKDHENGIDTGNVAYGIAKGIKCEGKNINGKTIDGGDVEFRQMDLSSVSRKIDYYIEFNNVGHIVKFYATDGEYQYAFWGEDRYEFFFEDSLKDEIIDKDSSEDYSFFDTNNGFKTVSKYKIDNKSKNFEEVVKYSKVLKISDGLKYCNNSYTGKTDGKCTFQYLKIQPNTCEVSVWTSATKQSHFVYN